jgi:methylenetetrahydrofolate reductase (NADPH)
MRHFCDEQSDSDVTFRTSESSHWSQLKMTMSQFEKWAKTWWLICVERSLTRKYIIFTCKVQSSNLLSDMLIFFFNYTMNLAQVTRMILNELDLILKDDTLTKKALSWRQSLDFNRREENVRLIFWKNRNKIYVTRTQNWNEFLNDRWEDFRSSTFDELNAYEIDLKGINEQNIKLWGKSKTLRNIANIFIRFLKKKLQSLSWSESLIIAESEEIKSKLIDLNNRDLLIITFQSSMNEAKSSHFIHEWDSHDEYVYQKAYLKIFISSKLMSKLIARIDRKSDVTFYAMNTNENLRINFLIDESNVVTWEMFSKKEIVQSIIVKTISFLIWKDEAFRFGIDWAHCHSSRSSSRKLISSIMNNWYLINIGMWLIVACDFIQVWDWRKHST